MEKYQIDSNRFIDIGGARFPLIADVVVQNNNTYIVKIPVPAMYADTLLKRKMSEINYNPAYNNFLFISMHKRDGTLSINYFTVAVNFPELQKIALPEELKPMKGLGRIILCRVLQHIRDVELITLEASPLATISEEFRTRIEAMPREILLEKCKRNPITHLKMVEFMRNSLRITLDPEDESFNAVILNSAYATTFLINLMSNLAALESLVKYYKTYGFIPESRLDHDYDSLIMSQTMSAPYETVLEKCIE